MAIFFWSGFCAIVKRVFACVAAWLLCTCIVNAIGNRTINAVDKRNGAKNFAESNVFFGIQKTRNKLELVGKENGVEGFKVQMEDSYFPTFPDCTMDNFRISKRNDVLLIQYRSYDKEVFDLFVKLNGDVEFIETDRTYTGWNEHKTYFVNTSGTLENRGNQVFYSLIINANQIHNYGTISSCFIQLFQDYLFNSGVLQVGEIPTEIVDLSLTHTTNKCVSPKFKKYVVENHGTFISKGKLKINGGLNYIEYGKSNFDDLYMSNGSISIDSEKSTVIAGNITGQVESLALREKSSFLANKISFSQLKNFTIGTNSSFHCQNSYNFNIGGNFMNSGDMTSGADMTLYLKNVPSSKQRGFIVAKGTLNYSYARKDKPKNSTNAPDITKDPLTRKYLLQHVPDPNSPAFKKLQKEFYRRKGYKPEANDSGFENPLQMLAKKIRQTIHTDHYLNTITYHYTVTKDKYGVEVSRILTNVTQTGYVWKKRTQDEKTRLAKELSKHRYEQMNQHF